MGSGITMESEKGDRRTWLRELSSLANVVVGSCARILRTPVQELQNEHHKACATCSIDDDLEQYARSFLEFCCLRALAVWTQTPGYLGDKNFRRMTFNMMLAWETPEAANVSETRKRGIQDFTTEKKSDLYYSALVPLLVDVKSTVCRQAFVHLGPAIAGVADILNVHRQYDALARPFGGRLTFRLYDKYVVELERAIETIKNQSHIYGTSRLKWSIDVSIIDAVQCTQQVGASTVHGKLILTTHELYFKSNWRVPHVRWNRWDLAAGQLHVLKPCLTGPWNWPLFDNGISCNLVTNAGHVTFGFPGPFNSGCRDYWLSIIKEVISAHQFTRLFQLERASTIEVFSRCVLGIARLRATMEAIRAFPINPELLLCFSTMGRGQSQDLMLRLLGNKLKDDILIQDKAPKTGLIFSQSASAIMCDSGFSNPFKMEKSDRRLNIGDMFFEEFSIFEKAIKQSDIGKNRLPRTMAGKSADNLSVNLAILKVLLATTNPVGVQISALQSWQEPFKTIVVLLLGSFIIIRDMWPYVLSLLVFGLATFIIFFQKAGEGNISGEILIVLPSRSGTVDQLVELQQLLFQIEEGLKSFNTVFLKIRALLYSVLPQVSDQVILCLIMCAFVLAVIPGKVTMLILFWEALTRQMPLRKEMTATYIEKLRQWWLDVPLVPVILMQGK